MRILSILLLVLLFERSQAQLIIQNTSAEEVFLVIQHYDKPTKVWKTQGWFKIEALESRTIFETITNRYYYFYARNTNRIWNGTESTGWIHPVNAFTTYSNKDYSATREFQRIGMSRIDVGKAKKFTLTLDTKTPFVKRLDEYFLKGKLDPIEGLYTISDEITIETSDESGKKSVQSVSKEHWAKVAIVKDSLAITRDYVEFIIEGTGYKEGEVKAEFLQTMQSPTLFLTKQFVKPGDTTHSANLEYNHEVGVIEGKFEYFNSGTRYKVKRSYLKYHPR